MEIVLSARHRGTVMLYGTTRLPGGRIEGSGVVRHDDPTESGAITAGTGAFAGAHGQVTVREDVAHKRDVLTVTLLP